MPAPLVSVESSPSLPREADVVVIGAGIVGSFAAYHLARRGLSVALVEKGAVGAEQSSRNWGWCRQQNRDARELPMATRSLALWEQFAADTGEDTGFRRCGLLYLSNDEAELAQWAKWREVARAFGLETHILTSAEATARGQASGRVWQGGVYSPTDGTADPSRAAPAVARALLRAGGTVHQACAARGLELEGGRVAGVVTETGTIRTRNAVLAGGAWASSFCRQLGVVFPQASVRQSSLAVGPGAPGLPDALHTAAVSITKRGDGGYTLAISGRARVDVTPQQLRFATRFIPMFAKRWRLLAPGGLEGVRSGHETLRRWRLDRPTPMERVRVLDPKPDPVSIRATYQRALDLMPELRGVPITASWAGYIDSTPDGVPSIGPVAEVPGLVLAAGFSGHGFGIGPGTGELVADLVTGATPAVRAKDFDPARLTASARGKVADF
ncbi:MAG: FAD-binding oxidoreductase [Rhodospirillales bacterium]|nr:FAD-binding oxidoreductase [Rhodospirillales bacterium]